MDIREHLSGRPDPMANQQQDSPELPKRMRTWDECGIEEKVERLRRELVAVKWLAGRASEAAGALSRGFFKVTRHGHEALGHVTVRLGDERHKPELDAGPGWLA